mmetsp:Transcript_5432/g.7111  ORF Transcript_5432/g.7111 Transcript_5432/m.7111 type:complete len:154 (-) Transcript_5432:121-582(-)
MISNLFLTFFAGEDTANEEEWEEVSTTSHIISLASSLPSDDIAVLSFKDAVVHGAGGTTSIPNPMDEMNPFSPYLQTPLDPSYYPTSTSTKSPRTKCLPRNNNDDEVGYADFWDSTFVREGVKDSRGGGWARKFRSLATRRKILENSQENEVW